MSRFQRAKGPLPAPLSKSNGARSSPKVAARAASGGPSGTAQQRRSRLAASGRESITAAF